MVSRSNCELGRSRAQQKSREEQIILIRHTYISGCFSILLSSVHSENPDFRWLTKLKIQNPDAPILKKLQDDPVLEKENKELKKALFEQKVLVAELQRKMLDQQEQARISEENLIKSNNEFKKEMKKKSEKTNSLIQDLIDMVKKQAKP